MTKKKFNRNNLSKNFKKPISLGNMKPIFNELDRIYNYILGLKCPDTNDLMVETNRKTGFLGFLVCIISFKKLFCRLLDKYGSKFFMSYKICQDNIQLFLGQIRSMRGWNNNPNCLQFRSSFKKLLVNNEIQENEKGNCLPLTSFKILTVSTSIEKEKISLPLSIRLIKSLNSNLDRNLFLEDSSPLEFTLDDDLDYVEALFSNIDIYYRDVIPYMAGFIVRKIKKYLKCINCCIAIEDLEHLVDRKYLNLILLKGYGGLTYPSKDVIDICASCEKHFKANCSQDLNVGVEKLVSLVSFSFVGIPLFKSLAQHDIDRSNYNYIVSSCLKLLPHHI